MKEAADATEAAGGHPVSGGCCGLRAGAAPAGARGAAVLAVPSGGWAAGAAARF